MGRNAGNHGVLGPCLVLVLAIETVGPGRGAALATETVAVDDGNPPFSYEASDGASGLYPALTRELFRRAGEPVTVQPMPLKRAVMMSETGTMGIAGVPRTPELEAIYDFSAPLMTEEIVIYVRRGHTFRYTTIDSLSKRRVGVLRGRDHGAAFNRARTDGTFDVEDASSDAQNIDKLAEARIDAALMPREAGDMELAANPEAGSQITPLDAVFQRDTIHIAFPKSAAKYDLLARIDRALTQMREDGSMHLLLDTIRRP